MYFEIFILIYVYINYINKSSYYTVSKYSENIIIKYNTTKKKIMYNKFLIMIIVIIILLSIGSSTTFIDNNILDLAHRIINNSNYTKALTIAEKILRNFDAGSGYSK